jgi:exosome complex component RRP40
VLDSLAFNGASKRNKPNLKVGDIVYAKVSEVTRYMPPVVTCVSKSCKKDWTTGESTFGELKEGIDLVLNYHICEQLKHDALIFDTLKRLVSFEIAIGANAK